MNEEIYLMLAEDKYVYSKLKNYKLMNKHYKLMNKHYKLTHLLKYPKFKDNPPFIINKHLDCIDLDYKTFIISQRLRLNTICEVRDYYNITLQYILNNDFKRKKYRFEYICIHNLNDDLLYSFLLYISIGYKIEEYCHKNNKIISYLYTSKQIYKEVISEVYRNTELLKTILQIKDYIIDKLKEDFIINEIISYLL